MISGEVITPTEKQIKAILKMSNTLSIKAIIPKTKKEATVLISSLIKNVTAKFKENKRLVFQDEEIDEIGSEGLWYGSDSDWFDSIY